MSLIIDTTLHVATLINIRALRTRQLKRQSTFCVRQTAEIIPLAHIKKCTLPLCLSAHYIKV